MTFVWSAVGLVLFLPQASPLQSSQTFRFRARMRYDGANFHGVQKNKRTQDDTELRTILSCLEQMLWPALEQRVRFRVASRTDAGVSASGQVLSFDAESSTNCSKTKEPQLTVHGSPVCASALAASLNACLPSDLQLHEVVVVPRSFDVGRDCLWKRYRYRLPACPSDDKGMRLLRMVASHTARAAREQAEESDGAPGPSPRRRRRQRGPPLQIVDVPAMSRCAALLEGTHDFTAFQSSGGDQKSTVRTIFRCVVEPRTGTGEACTGEEGVDVVVELDGALYKMVRIIAGTLAMVGMGLAAPETVLAALCSEPADGLGGVAASAGVGTQAQTMAWPKAELRRRGIVGPILPPEPLCLEHIEYDINHESTVLQRRQARHRHQTSEAQASDKRRMNRL